MSDDLDLRGIDSRYEPSPQFRAALQRRVAAIVEGADPGSVTSARDMEVMDFEPAGAPSAPSRNRRLVAQVILAAAAVAVIALVATRDDGSTPADQPGSTVTVTSTAPPRALITAERNPEQLVPGSYFADWFGEFVTPMRIVVNLGAGWTIGADGWNPTDYRDQFPLGMILWETGKGVGAGNQAGGLGFSHAGDEVFSDACHPSKGYAPGDVASVDGLVDALRAQAGWADVTTASDISVDGYAGKAFQRTAPTDMSDCDTAGPGGLRDGSFGMRPDFRSWGSGPNETLPYEPGQTETVWVLDIDSTVVVINASLYADASETDRAELAAALDSIRIVASPDDATPADQPSPTVTLPPAALPRPLLNHPSDEVPLDPGTYYVDSVTGTPTPRIYATLDSGWYDLDGRPGWQHIAKGRLPDAIGYVAFSNPVAVFLDACHPMDGFYAGSVATVDGFVTALMEQQGGWVDVTVPSDISIDGYVGKTFQRTAPADISDCTSRDGGTEDDGQARLPSWDTPIGINDGYAPGQVETLWILDLDGTVVVISTELRPLPSAAAHADFADAVVDSIRIDRP